MNLMLSFIVASVSSSGSVSSIVATFPVATVAALCFAEAVLVTFYVLSIHQAPELQWFCCPEILNCSWVGFLSMPWSWFAFNELIRTVRSDKKTKSSPFYSVSKLFIKNLTPQLGDIWNETRNFKKSYAYLKLTFHWYFYNASLNRLTIFNIKNLIRML